MGVSWETAKSEGRAIGVFQVLLAVHKHHDPERLLDPDYNIDVAYELSNGGRNTNPWISSVSCWG